MDLSQTRKTLPTLIVDPLEGGHRHLYVKLIFEFIQSSRLEDVKSVLFYIHESTAAAVEVGFDAKSKAIFRSRVITPLVGKGGLREVLVVAARHEAGQIVLLELDSFLHSLLLEDLPIPCSGFWFRPSFHYGLSKMRHENAKQRLTAIYKWLALKVLLSKRSIHKIYVLDPWAETYAKNRFQNAKVTYLPDPMGFKQFPLPKKPASDRFVVSVIGGISKRKGIGTILTALRLLSPEDQEKLELRIVGRTATSERDDLLGLIDRLRSETAVRVSHTDAFVSDERIDLEVAHADLLLLLYQRFIGSSGLLIRSAMYGTPVLATDCGLVGVTVPKHRLGRIVDPHDPSAIAETLRQVLSTGETGLCKEDATQYALSHSPDFYQREISCLIPAQFQERLQAS